MLLWSHKNEQIHLRTQIVPSQSARARTSFLVDMPSQCQPLRQRLLRMVEFFRINDCSAESSGPSGPRMNEPLSSRKGLFAVHPLLHSIRDLLPSS